MDPMGIYRPIPPTPLYVVYIYIYIHIYLIFFARYPRFTMEKMAPISARTVTAEDTLLELEVKNSKRSGSGFPYESSGVHDESLYIMNGY